MRLEQQNVTDLIRLLDEDNVRMVRPIHTSDLDIYLESGSMKPVTVLDLIQCHIGLDSFTVLADLDGELVARIPNEGWNL